jgi:hypothetical protein
MGLGFWNEWKPNWKLCKDFVVPHKLIPIFKLFYKPQKQQQQNQRSTKGKVYLVLSSMGIRTMRLHIGSSIGLWNWARYGWRNASYGVHKPPPNEIVPSILFVIFINLPKIRPILIVSQRGRDETTLPNSHGWNFKRKIGA